jgi:hypothetical protein
MMPSLCDLKVACADFRTGAIVTEGQVSRMAVQEGDYQRLSAFIASTIFMVSTLTRVTRLRRSMTFSL